jgi:hypothetical protein
VNPSGAAVLPVDATIQKAIRTELWRSRCPVVTEHGELHGTVSDGDIRRLAQGLISAAP